MGGIVLTLIGIGMDGHLGNVTAGGLAIIFYLAMVSAVAYTLWSILLAWNDVSKVAIFGFVNPLCSVILSALILGEVKQAFNVGSLVALVLVCAGIYIVNRRKKLSIVILNNPFITCFKEKIKTSMESAPFFIRFS